MKKNVFIKSIEAENWQNFTFLAKKLGKTQSQLFEEMLNSFVVEHENDLKNIFINVNKKEIIETEEISPLLQADIDILNTTFQTLSAPELLKRENRLYFVFIENRQSSKKDKKTAQEWFDKCRVRRKELESQTNNRIIWRK